MSTAYRMVDAFPFALSRSQRTYHAFPNADRMRHTKSPSETLDIRMPFRGRRKVSDHGRRVRACICISLYKCLGRSYGV